MGVAILFDGKVRLGHHGMYVTALRIHGLAILFDDKVPWTSWSNLWLLFLPCRGWGGRGEPHLLSL